MRLSDNIIDTSKSRDEAVARIKKQAEANYGLEYVDLLIENSESEDEAISKMKKAADTKPENPNNLENKPMVDVRGLKDLTTPEEWYGGLKNLSLIAKPASFMATPVTETLRAPFKYIAENVGENTSQTPPINTAAEYESVYPSDRAGLGLLLRDISNAAGIKTEPMADIKSEKYPKLAQFMKQMTDPVNVGGAALDVMAGMKIPNPKIVSGGASVVGDVYSALGKEVPPGVNRAMLSNRIPKMSLETATDYVRAIAKDKQKLAELERSGGIYNIGKMVQENPDKYFSPLSPNKIYENIMGDLLPDEATRVGSKGELSRMNRLQEGLIEEIPSDVYTVPREELRLSALNELGEQGLEATQMESAQRFIDKNIPITQPDPAKLARYRSEPGYGDFTGAPSPTDTFLPTEYDYMDYIRSLNEEPIIYASNMRKLGNKLREPVMAGEVSTDIAARNAAGRALERAARKAQDQAMGFMDPADVSIYNQQNQKISDLLNLRDLAQGNLQNPALNAPTPWMPSTWARGINRYIKPIAQSMGSDLGNMARSGTAGMGAPILSATEFLNSKSGVNLFQIPRTSEGALQNIDLVKAKIEREFGPEVVMQMDSIKDSASFTNFMADLANMNPMAFTPDPYNRFDGVIKHPVLKTKALEDIVKNGNMSVLDKANSAEELMINSKFHEVQK